MKNNQKLFSIFCGLMLFCGFAIYPELGVAAEEIGNISVSTSPVDGDIYIDTYPVGSGYYIGEYETGTYTISFRKVTGFRTPESQIINLEANDTEYINVTYIEIPEGILIVNTTPVSGDIYVNGDKVGNGYFEGKYEENTVLEISFGDVKGYITPNDEEVIIIADEQTSREGKYEEIPMGWINVTTISDDGKINGDAGMIFIDGDSEGTGSCNKSFYGETTHSVSFGDVDRYIKPVDQSVDVKAGEVISAIGNYIKRTTYWINITTTSDDGKINGDQGEIFVDNTSIGVGLGAIEVYENSNRTISFGKIEGYKKPDLISVSEITRDMNISGIYIHIPKYTINITTEPVEGEIEVNEVFKGKGSFEDEYYEGTNLTVSFKEVGDCFVGYNTPEPLNITVNSNKSEIVYYTKIPGIKISIITATEDGSNINGPIYVDGIFQGSGGVELECRSNMMHEISYGDCEQYYDNERKQPKYITPTSETINISKSNYVEGIYGMKKYPPIAKIIPVLPETALYEDVTFNAGASYDLGGRIVRYIWDFSDGTAEGEVTSHEFTTTGEKNIILTVIDNDGIQSTDMVTVIVKRKPIVKLTKINNTRIGIAIFNPMVRPADPNKSPAAVSVVATVEVNSRIGVDMSTGGPFNCNLDQGEKFEEVISMECDESYDVWVEYTYRFQDENELRSSRTDSLRMPAKPGSKQQNSIPNLPAWIGVFIILMVFIIKKRRN
ncbi:MAG: hypothetical protein C5S40_05950 [ANME-2 cluster archaeon]|nr:hypothetical protein [ANME-2 cluster archaeon]